jgi:hypothetical protein
MCKFMYMLHDGFKCLLVYADENTCAFFTRSASEYMLVARYTHLNAKARLNSTSACNYIAPQMSMLSWPFR